jgi:MFS-type transporter involved in bile tolerance (Atg22 family)
MLLASVVMVGVKTTVELDKSDQKDKAESGVKHTTLLSSAVALFKGSLGRFIVVRSCFVHTALLAPFFVVWCTNLNLQSQWLSLSLFIIAQASAAIMSSYAWGRLSDKNSNLSPYWYIFLYLCLSLGHEGARAGRKVYALDIKQGSERTRFIGQANSAIGAVLLALGLFYSVLSMLGSIWIFVVMALGLVAGLVASLQLKKEK